MTGAAHMFTQTGRQTLPGVGGEWAETYHIHFLILPILRLAASCLEHLSFFETHGFSRLPFGAFTTLQISLEPFGLHFAHGSCSACALSVDGAQTA